MPFDLVISGAYKRTAGLLRAIGAFSFSARLFSLHARFVFGIEQVCTFL